MIRVGLFSHDSKLQPLLSSALGKDFQVFFQADETGINRLLTGGNCSVMILDLASNHEATRERIESARRLVDSQIPWVIMADDSLRTIATELIRQGGYAYCRRPPSIRDLKMLLQRAHEGSPVKQPEPVQPRDEAEDDPHKIVGSSPQTQRMFQQIRSVTNLNASVLITGKSGTGKELVARAIHSLGSRAIRPFVAVACSAIPETLIESELFGHEKGAFTGSTSTREGYFEQASDGTLFLDEIGELTHYTQVKLLRVLQQREFCRLGSTKLIPLRARVIFATHQDLEELVAMGKFRQDLFYRINVMRIETPALQDHPEDIPQIALHFLRRYSQTYEKPMHDIDPEAMELLQNYDWPGNVRELENVIQRAIVSAEGQIVRADDLPLIVRREPLRLVSELGFDGAESDPTGVFDKMLRDYKIKLVANAVREHNGNKTLAARSLCISRAYLHRLLRLAETGESYEPVSRLVGQI